MYQFPTTLHISLVVVSCINVCVRSVFSVMYVQVEFLCVIGII
jgi:hypothetical protein